MNRKLFAIVAGACAVTGGGAAIAATAATNATSTVTATLKPGNEVPKPTGAHGSGTFTGTLTKAGRLTYRITYKGLTGKAVQAHLHSGKAGVSGPIVVALCPPKCASPIVGTRLLSKAVAAKLRAGTIYVNIHTKKNPAGELRGQLHVR